MKQHPNISHQPVAMPAQVRPLGEPLVAASVELYRCVVRDMLPTPSKSHYLFNTRDLAKLILGVMQVGGWSMGTLDAAWVSGDRRHG